MFSQNAGFGLKLAATRKVYEVCRINFRNINSKFMRDKIKSEFYGKII